MLILAGKQEVCKYIGPKVEGKQEARIKPLSVLFAGCAGLPWLSVTCQVHTGSSNSREKDHCTALKESRSNIPIVKSILSILSKSLKRIQINMFFFKVCMVCRILGYGNWKTLARYDYSMTITASFILTCGNRQFLSGVYQSVFKSTSCG